MKKLFVGLSALVLCACAGINKNTVSYQMSQYDAQIYYVVSGEGPTQEEAAAAARANMRQNIMQSTKDAQLVAQVVDDILANAKTGKVWRDKSRKEPKNYFALVVLKRATALQILQVPCNDIDARLGALAAQLQANTETFAGLRSAFAMQPLIVKRNVLQDLYIFLSENHQGYETERFDTYKKLYNDRLAAVKVAAVVRGEENVVLLAHITDAVNRMGLSVVTPEDTGALLSVEVDAQVDGYQSERLKGLEWAATSATVSLRDLKANATFARFNVNDRAGTGRQSDSVRKSMDSLGKKAADEIVTRLTDYLKTK